MPNENAHTSLVQVLVAAAKREDELLESLVAAVSAGDNEAILDAARAVSANRQQGENANK